MQPLMLSRAASISHRIWDWKEFKAIFDEQEVEDVVSRSSNGGGRGGGEEYVSEIKLKPLFEEDGENNR